LRLLGRRDVAVTGIFAIPGSRSHRILLRLLRSLPVVTLSSSEAESWSAWGGRAKAVTYGNTFGYPSRHESDEPLLRVFIGGSSDRDQDAIASLEREVRASDLAVRLTVVDGSPPGHWFQGLSEITHTGYVDSVEFGNLIAASDVVVLPLRENNRAAGHMVLIGALEAGVPVLISRTSGVAEYIDGTWVKALDPCLPILTQAQRHAATAGAASASIREYWQSRFSLEAYVGRVGSALRELTR
ncbi:MAG: glycosyltransferase family 4 protein, partial [Isosphaeraceae bacterium]